MGQPFLSDEQIQKLIQSVQSAEQAVQEVKQSLMGAGILQKDQASGQANLGYNNMTNDISVPEALENKTYNDNELWTFDKKLIAASELDARNRSADHDANLKDLELRRKEHDFAVQQKLDNLHVRSAEQAELFKHAVNMEYAKFNAAASEPIAPNTKDGGSKADVEGE